MALPVFRRFSIADMPTAPNWIVNLLNPLNVFCEGTVANLNKNLTIGANVQGQKNSTSFTTPADYATGGFSPITFVYNSNGQPNCLLIGSLTSNDGTLLLNPYSITSWSANINVSPIQVSAYYIAGLSASTKYNITLLAL